MTSLRVPPRSWFRATARALIALAAGAALIAGCGGAKNSDSSSTSSSPASTPEPASPPSETTVTTSPAGSGSPVASDDLGAKVFAQRCALCHGPDGHGDGPGSKALNPKPRNFHDTAYMSSRTDAQLLATIHTGKGAMPKWGGVLSEAEITAVFAHVRKLGKKP